MSIVYGFGPSSKSRHKSNATARASAEDRIRIRLFSTQRYGWSLRMIRDVNYTNSLETWMRINLMLFATRKKNYWQTEVEIGLMRLRFRYNDPPAAIGHWEICRQQWSRRRDGWRWRRWCGDVMCVFATGGMSEAFCFGSQQCGSTKYCCHTHVKCISNRCRCQQQQTRIWILHTRALENNRIVQPFEANGKMRKQFHYLLV